MLVPADDLDEILNRSQLLSWFANLQPFFCFKFDPFCFKIRFCCLHPFVHSFQVSHGGFWQTLVLDFAAAHLTLISKSLGAQLRIIEVYSHLARAFLYHFNRLLKHTVQMLPKFLVPKITRVSCREAFRLLDGKIQTTVAKGAALAPAVAIIVNARDKTRIASQLRELLRIHPSSG